MEQLSYSATRRVSELPRSSKCWKILTQVINTPFSICLGINLFKVEGAETTTTSVSVSHINCATVQVVSLPQLLTFQRCCKCRTVGDDINELCVRKLAMIPRTFKPISWILSERSLIPFGNFWGSATGAPVALSRAGACQPLPKNYTCG